MESLSCLKTGQEISLYVDISGQAQVKLITRLMWAREGRDGRNAAQMSIGEIMDLYQQA